MKMKKVLILILLIVGNATFSQKIEYIEKNDTLQKPIDKIFVYIFPETDLTTSKNVAKIKSTGKLNEVHSIFQNLENAAQKIGANAFRFENFTKLDENFAELTLTAYFCEDSIFDINYKYVPKNKVYIFGNQNLADLKKQNFKINGEKYEIQSGNYKAFDVKIGEELKINKGGITGMTFWIKGVDDKSATFLSFTGLGFGGVSYNPQFGSGGININTGRINRIEPNFALTLLKIFQEQK
jgi:hypothetical protein